VVVADLYHVERCDAINCKTLLFVTKQKGGGPSGIGYVVKSFLGHLFISPAIANCNDAICGYRRTLNTV
jgi:hypothetical protein